MPSGPNTLPPQSNHNQVSFDPNMDPHGNRVTTELGRAALEGVTLAQVRAAELDAVNAMLGLGHNTSETDQRTTDETINNAMGLRQQYNTQHNAPRR